MYKIALASLLSLTILSCGKSPFSDTEEKLIKQEPNTSPFRILLITNEQDSLILRTKCADIEYTKGNKDIEYFISRMEATLEESQGVGLAAPQVGVCKNIFLFKRIDKEGSPVEVAINPRIVKTADTTVCFQDDGCLSIPDVWGNSIRYPWVEVEYINRKGEKVTERLSGYSREDNFVGIIFQHEYDHLDGVLFTDKLCPDNESDAEYEDLEAVDL